MHCFSILHVQRYLSISRRLAGPSVSTTTVVSTQTSETFAAHGCQRSLTRPQVKCRDVFKRIFAHTAFRASQALPCSVCNNVYASTPCDLQHIAGYSPAMRITFFHPCVEEGFSFVLVGGKGISLVALTVLRFSPNRGLSPQALPRAAGVALRHRVARHCWRSRLLSNHFRCRRPSTRSAATKQPLRHRVARHCWRNRLVSNHVRCRGASSRPAATKQTWLLSWR